VKDRDESTLAMALNQEKMERVLRRDREELELERQIEKLGNKTSSPKKRKERVELIKKISRKYYEIANDMVEDAQYSEAIDLYSKSISIMRKVGNVKPADSYFNRAITLAMMGYPRMALDDLNKIVKANPPKADVYFVKGQIFQSMGKDRLAEREYRKCLKIDPEFYRASRSLENLRIK
jgi:tetratricopeptide (TPR) repeat protein